MIKYLFIFGLCLVGDLVLADFYAAQNGQVPESPYTTWETAASNIQDAVNVATNATVWVGAGRYTVPPNGVVYNNITNVVCINRPLTLRSSNGLPASVTIDGEGTNRGVHFAYNVTTTNMFVLSGFTVYKACTNGVLFTANNGILWTGVVENCIITNSITLGKAIDGSAANSIAVIISNSVICNNAGAAVNFYGSAANLVVTDCTVENNVSLGFSFHLGSHTLTRCIIRGNAGAFSIGSGLNQLFSCLLCNNVTNLGGAIYGWNNGSDIRIYNTTIVSNRATGAGGGLRTSGSSASFKLYNTIVYSNSPNNFDFSGNTNSFLTNCCSIPSNAFFVLSSTGNLTNPPAFVDFAGQNFRLTPASPCINRGLNQPWMDGAKDLDNRSRKDVFSGLADIGCYEYHPQGLMFTVR